MTPDTTGDGFSGSIRTLMEAAVPPSRQKGVADFALFNAYVSQRTINAFMDGDSYRDPQLHPEFEVIMYDRLVMWRHRTPFREQDYSNWRTTSVSPTLEHSNGTSLKIMRDVVHRQCRGQTFRPVFNRLLLVPMNDTDVRRSTGSSHRISHTTTLTAHNMAEAALSVIHASAF